MNFGQVIAKLFARNNDYICEVYLNPEDINNEGFYGFLESTFEVDTTKAYKLVVQGR